MHGIKSLLMQAYGFTLTSKYPRISISLTGEVMMMMQPANRAQTLITVVALIVFSTAAWADAWNEQGDALSMPLTRLTSSWGNECQQ